MAVVPVSTRIEPRGRDIRALTGTVRATVGFVFGEGDPARGEQRAPLSDDERLQIPSGAVPARLPRPPGLPLTTPIPILKTDLPPDTWSPLRRARAEGGYALLVAELLM